MQILLRRLLTSIPTLLMLSLLVFLLLELAPGDAVDVTLDQTASEEARAVVRAELGLDQPLLRRYLAYLGGLLHGDMGDSASTGRPVMTEIMARLPYTLVLVVAAVALALIAGVTVGTFSALKQGTVWDTLLRVMISVTMAVPVFWLALVLVNFFAVKLAWLPVFGANSARHLILPAVCTAFPLVPGIARLTRSSLLEAMDQDFVLVARGKGLYRRMVLLRHIAPVAAITVVTYVGLQVVRLIGSLVIIETIFNWPGLGGLVVQAAFDRDPMLLQGTTLIIAALTFAVLLAVDLLVMLLDPRISTRAV
jgi:peptide/nickel transport system permease protein